MLSGVSIVIEPLTGLDLSVSSLKKESSEFVMMLWSCFAVGVAWGRPFVVRRAGLHAVNTVKQIQKIAFQHPKDQPGGIVGALPL